VDDRLGRDGLLYLVKWKNHGAQDATWERESDLKDADLIDAYWPMLNENESVAEDRAVCGVRCAGERQRQSRVEKQSGRVA